MDRNQGIYDWPISTLNGTNILPSYNNQLPLIAIIDSGVNVNNPFLKNAKIQQFVLDDISTHSSSKHGTMVAGILVGQGDGHSSPGGLVPHANVISIQTGTDLGMTSDQLASAITKAVELHAKIINISSGTLEPSNALSNAVNHAISKGIVIVAAAGNENQKRNVYPAAYNEVIAVSTITNKGFPGHNTNYHQQNVYAPGDRLLTTSPVEQEKSVRFSGSSAATPIVTAICAVLLMENENIKPNELKDVLWKTARKFDHDGISVSIIDVKAALKALRSP
ncbi:S8 family serine peptidase [Paenibacillus chitinolyticus]|uniref:S8 family peptidase n=1 Tax=Paenibacillus chitinolyticus TaxID=79263 RepID=UPI0036D8A98B